MNTDKQIKILALFTILITLCAVLCIVFYQIETVYRELEIGALERIARAEGVPVFYVSYDRLQEIVKDSIEPGQSVAGCYLPGRKAIYVAIEYRNDYTILAHELGHHYGVILYGDHSEETANRIGKELIEEGRYDGE